MQIYIYILFRDEYLSFLQAQPCNLDIRWGSPCPLYQEDAVGHIKLYSRTPGIPLVILKDFFPILFNFFFPQICLLPPVLWLSPYVTQNTIQSHCEWSQLCQKSKMGWCGRCHIITKLILLTLKYSALILQTCHVSGQSFVSLAFQVFPIPK